MERRSLAGVVAAIGVAMVLLSLLADTLGIGQAGFGWKRGVLLAAGIVVVLVGVFLALTPAVEGGPAAGGTEPAPPEPDSAEAPGESGPGPA
jgi:hypothetical protein